MIDGEHEEFGSGFGMWEFWGGKNSRDSDNLLGAVDASAIIIRAAVPAVDPEVDGCRQHSAQRSADAVTT